MAGFEHTVTHLPEESEYPKLVRDLIPDIIKNEEGKDARVEVLSDGDFEFRLKNKAVEEAAELAATETDAHLLEEIADLREILDTLERLKGFTPEQVQEVQDAKRRKRGGFVKKLLMLEGVN